jgi:hypothetical protein
MKSYTKILSVLDDSLDIVQQISRVLLTVMFAILSGAVQGYHIVKDKWIAYKYAESASSLRPLTRYYLSSDHIPFEDSDETVPEDCVYIEEWVDAKGHKKNVVLYEGERIPTSWTASPFDTPAKCPWVWVGDRDTEIDLTRTFNKFLVPGNRILLDLVCNLIQVNDRTNLIYIESGTFNEIKFPGDGVTIKADVDPADQPVSTR